MAAHSPRIHHIDLRELGMSVLFAAIVLFVAAMAMLSRNVSQLNESYRWVEKSNTVLRHMYDVELKIAGVEMTVRGFAVSSHPMFVRMHRQNHDKLLAAMKLLGNQVTDEPALKPDYLKLRDLVDRHEALYSSLMALGPGHQDAVAEAITNPLKRHDRSVTNVMINKMRSTELAILGQRQEETQHRAKSTYRLALGIAAFAFLAGTLGFTLTLFGRRQPDAGLPKDAILPHDLGAIGS